MAPKADDLAKVRKLLLAVKERREQIDELLGEVDALLWGGVAIGEQLKAVYAKWYELHATRYAGRYVFAFQKDAPQAKRLIKLLGLEELVERMANYIRDSDPYLTKARHPFGLFVAGVNRYASAGADTALELEAEPVGCAHDPKCKSDVEHTRRRVADLRALRT